MHLLHTKVLRNLRPHLPWVLGLLLISLLLLRYFWSTTAWIETHDGIFHVVRLEAFTESFRLGSFPVRWAGSLDHGFGLPLFNYVYPAPYYLGLPLTLLGLSSKWAIKFIEIAFYLIGGLGMYTLFARYGRSRAALSALLYLATPYLLLNLFIRGSLGEFMAISLIPWTILVANDIHLRGKISWYSPLPYLLLFLSHNFLSFLFLPIYVLYAFLKRKHFFSVLFSLGFSLGLAAFFLLPMILERGYVYSAASGDFTYNYVNHFVYLQQLIYSSWGNGFSVPGPGDGISFQLGFVQLLVLPSAFVFAWRKKLNSSALLWLAVSVGTILFMLPLASPVWDLIFPLQIIQFPWRLLALTTVAIPFLSQAVLADLSARQIRWIGIPLAVLCLVFAWVYSTPFNLQDNAEFAKQLYIHREQTTTSSRLELLPRWAPVESRWRGDESLRILGGDAQITLQTQNALSLTFSSVTSDPAASYLIRRNYFPSWRASDENGYSLPLEPYDGEIVLHPAVGSHIYRVEVGSTPLESAANLISLLTILALVVFTTPCPKLQIIHKR